MAQYNTEEAIQIEKLSDSTNFQVWKFQITIMLKSSSLYEIVSGEKVKTESMSEKDKADWTLKDAKAQRIIITTISKIPLSHLLNCTSSYEMFKKLTAIYERDTQQQKCSLLQQFFNHTFKNTDIATHISTLENLAYKLNALNQQIDETMLITKILATLPHQYKHFASAWESTAETERTITNLTSRLLIEENRLNTDGNKDELVAFQASSVKCYKCDGSNHLARDCKASGQNNHKTYYKNKTGNTYKGKRYDDLRPQPRCGICKKTNHQERNCYFRNKQNNSNKQDSTKVCFLSSVSQTINEIETNEWVVDSGASTHMTKNRNMIEEIQETNTEIKTAKNNSILRSTGRGNINSTNCTLSNVLAIPDLSRNLLSVNAITDKDGVVKFSKNNVEIKKHGKLILKGNKTQDGLYTVKLDMPVMNESLLANTEDNMLWHRRLGHISFPNLRKVTFLSTGIKLKENSEMAFCDICARAKQTRMPFTKERTRATRVLEIVHTDVCGPIDPPTWDDKHYFVTILDDFTHFAAIFPIKGKFEVADTVIEYLEQCQNKWNIKTFKIRSDNGKEFSNATLINWCKKNGTVLDFTAPYSPQQNGKAERLNRTILERTRALLFDSGLNKIMWGEAARTAVYLINRSPTEATHKTPAENWYNKTPDMKNIKIFGCKAYAKTVTYNKKLEDRNKTYNLVGYTQNSYRLWDIKNKKIIIARDVMFYEINNTTEKSNDKTTIKITNQNDEQDNTEHFEESDNEENESNDLDVSEVWHTGTSGEEDDNRTSPRRGSRIRAVPERYGEYYVHLTYTDVLNSADSDKWKKAIDEEKESLLTNETWKEVNEVETAGKKILSTRWVFKIKEDGTYKARLVARGCEQRKGLDYEDTYAPVINFSVLRLVFSLIPQKRIHVAKFDVKTAFLYGHLKEDLYIHLPEGFSDHTKICKLQKALYGLKQAPLSWNERFTKFLEKVGLISIAADPCVFKTKDKDLTILILYVDDGIIISENENKLSTLIKSLTQEFNMKFFNTLHTFLGMNIDIRDKTLQLDQTDYTIDVLKKFNMQDCNAVSIPMSDTKENIDSLEDKVFPYRELIGSLLYLSSKTRPDICFAVNYLSRFMNNPTRSNIIAAKRILRYLRGSSDAKLTYGINTDNEGELIGYTDADFAGDVTTRKSTSGYIIFYNGGPISWSSRKQSMVTLSTTEAEFIAATECCKELIYLKRILEAITEKEIKAKLLIDNQSTIS